ncbi:DUF3592 domain-containing protein [Streptomyces syringium]|uniref:DUF3592 domain-containing protein n=1 Tax=Streptomyces syringium TaxID=76729 RepID=UPI0033F35CB4
MFDVFALALPSLLAVGGISAMIWAVVRLRRLRSAWRSGLTAHAVCLRSYATTRTRRSGPHRSSSTTLTHLYEFTTPEGQTLRFEESGGPSSVVPGDTVPVRYPAGRPDRATAIPPGDSKTLVGIGVLLAFLTVFVTACVGFGVFYLTVFGGLKDKAKDVIERSEDGVNAPAHSPSAPTGPPDGFPTGPPKDFPTGPPEGFPSDLPTGMPTDLPTGFPTGFPSGFPGGR